MCKLIKDFCKNETKNETKKNFVECFTFFVNNPLVYRKNYQLNM